MKIGFAVLSHEDYLDPLVKQMTDAAVDSLEKAEVEVLRSDPLVTQRDAIAWSVRFLGSDVDGIVLFLASWVDCSVVITVVQEIGNLPVLLWGFPMTEIDGVRQSTGSYVSLAMIQGVMHRIGRPFERLLASPGETSSTDSALRFCRVASARKQMRRSRLGLVGYSAMSIYPGTFDHVMLRTLVGPEVVHIDSYSVIQKVGHIPEADVETQVHWLRDVARISDDVAERDLQIAAGVTLALQTLCKDLDLDGINVKCQYEFSKEFGAVACVPISSLADLGVVSSCEGDMMCNVSMLLLNRLSGKPVSYGDSIDHTGDVLTLSACGFMPYSFGDRENRLIRKFMPHPAFHGIQNSFVGRPGKITMLRIIEDIGAYHVLLFTGEVLPDSRLRQGYMPAVDVHIDGSMEELARQFNGQHYAFTYGDWSEEVLLYCRLAGIRVIHVK